MRKFHLKDSLWGGFISLFVVIPTLFLSDVLKPKPYSEVEVIEVSQEDRSVYLVANFVKNDACNFQTLSVFGEKFDRWSGPLDWRDSDKPRGDRIAGHQTLNIVIDTLGTEYDILEVRTRHLCDGGKVDKVFATLRLE